MIYKAYYLQEEECEKNTILRALNTIHLTSIWGSRTRLLLVIPKSNKLKFT